MKTQHVKRVAVCGLMVCSLSFIAPQGAWAQALPAGVSKGPSVEGITEYHLPNGLKVLLFPDAS
ncbi:MAG TPA: hypothetical protein VFT05_04500, partial [Burkholderiaceae bacterium]|nr:hypothetical protein [Burkholderiaceae bacterium]